MKAAVVRGVRGVCGVNGLVGEMIAYGRSARYAVPMVAASRTTGLGTTPIPPGPSADLVRAAVAEAVRALGEVGDAALREVRERQGGVGVGVCVPGVYDADRACVVASVNVPGLVGVPLADVLGLEGMRARVVSDAYAGAFDVWAGGCRGDGRVHERSRWRGRLIGLAMGTGVGMAVVDDGVQLCVTGGARGAGGVWGSSGHIGQVDVTLDECDASTPVGADGGRGSLEAYVGARALRARYGEDAERRLECLGKADAPLRALARAIRIVHAIYKPRHVVLLGGVGIRLKGSLGALRELVDDGLTSVAQKEWTLDVGEHEYHAASGAARLSVWGSAAEGR